MITMTIAMMIMDLMNGMKAIKNARLKKPQLKENSYPLLGIHQDGGIGSYQETRKKRQKNCGSNR